MRLVNLADTNLQYMNDSLLLSLISFTTKKQAIAYAKSIGWQTNDPMRVHGRLNGYRWIIMDSHYNAIAHPPKPTCDCDAFNTYGRCTHVEHIHTQACYTEFGKMVCGA
jgi:hypothetical protein